jgi:hypothetical protein
MLGREIGVLDQLGIAREILANPITSAHAYAARRL